MIFLGHIPLDDLYFHPNALPYFLHWMSLVSLESLEEVKQAIIGSHTAPPGDRVTAQVTAADEQESTYTLLVSTGVCPFRPGEGIALSRSSVSRREYIVEITKVAGNMLTAVVTWPTTVDDRSKMNLTAGERDWYLYKFPSLVGHKRIAAALKRFANMRTCSEALFERIVGSFGSVCCNEGREAHNNCNMQLSKSEVNEKAISPEGKQCV